MHNKYESELDYRKKNTYKVKKYLYIYIFLIN